jgi:hypothetical protein
LHALQLVTNKLDGQNFFAFGGNDPQVDDF